VHNVTGEGGGKRHGAGAGRNDNIVMAGIRFNGDTRTIDDWMIEP
jgi:hypothetical protein